MAEGATRAFGYDVRPSGARSSQRRASWMVENVL